MATTDKNTIVEDLYTLDLDCSVDDLIGQLNKVKEEHAATFDELGITVNYYDYDSWCIEVRGRRLETDAELAIRLAKNEKLKIKAEKRSLAHLKTKTLLTEAQQIRLTELQKKYP